MRVTRLLRALAIVLAAVAAIDPGWTSRQQSPLPIDVRAADIADARLAEDVRLRLRDMDDVAVDGSANPAAIVLVGKSAPPESLPSDIPISMVSRPDGPNVVVEDVAAPRLLLPGLTARIEATVSASGMAGTTSRIALEFQGVELSAVEHRWTAETEMYTARFEHVPPVAGTGVIRLVARPIDRELVTEDNQADMQVIVEDRKCRVLVHEPRPSWATTFVRRVLEDDPVFEVTALARPSRGISARAGNAPAQLSARALERFDVVIAGAPEELRQGELTALAEFSQRRGGTVVFVPDRRPAGLYDGQMPFVRFDEALLQAPAGLQGTTPPMKGSEFITIVDPPAGVETLAALPRQKGPVPVIVSWPTGAGRTIFSGALDAWRYRTADGAFGQFWKAQIAHAAMRAPRTLEVELDPAPAVPGELVAVKARVRPTQFVLRGSSIEFPRMSGRLVAGDGLALPVRLWPTAESGVFEGRFRAPEPGRYVVEIAAAGATSSQPLIVASGARYPHPGSPEAIRQLATATGGVVVPASDLLAVERLLSAMPRPSIAKTFHPARSIGWELAFIGLLSAEWWLRRRHGHA